MAGVVGTARHHDPRPRRLEDGVLPRLRGRARIPDDVRLRPAPPAPRGEREDRRLCGRRRVGDLLAHRTRAVHPARLLQRELCGSALPFTSSSSRSSRRSPEPRLTARRQPHIDALAAHVRSLRARRERRGERPRSRDARHGAFSGQLLAGSAAGLRTWAGTPASHDLPAGAGVVPAGRDARSEVRDGALGRRR